MKEIIHVDRLMEIFLKKEKDFLKEQEFVRKMIVSEIYNNLEKKFVLRPVDRFYFPTQDRPVAELSREGLTIRGNVRTLPFEWLRFLDTHLLLRVLKLIQATKKQKAEIRKQRLEEGLKKRRETIKQKKRDAKKLHNKK